MIKLFTFPAILILILFSSCHFDDDLAVDKYVKKYSLDKVAFVDERTYKDSVVIIPSYWDEIQSEYSNLESASRDSVSKFITKIHTILYDKDFRLVPKKFYKKRKIVMFPFKQERRLYMVLIFDVNGRKVEGDNILYCSKLDRILMGSLSIISKMPLNLEPLPLFELQKR